MPNGLLKRTHLALVMIGACLVQLVVPGALWAQTDLDPDDPNDVVILADLVSGQIPSVAVGDKVFSMFVYTNSGDMPAASAVNVSGFRDEDNNFGLTLHGVFQDDPNTFAGSLAALNFDVEVSDAGQQLGRTITDAHLFLGGVGVPDNSLFRVDESFSNSNQSLSVFSTNFLQQKDEQLSDWLDFSQPAVSRNVTLAILATTSLHAILPAHASVIDLTFSQTEIPEPSTMLLVLLAGTISGLRRRRLIQR